MSHRIRLARVAAIALFTMTLAACAARTTTPAAPPTPQFPDFVFPAVTDPALASFAEQQRASWQWLQSGDLRAADRGFSGILRTRPAFAPAESGLGYVALARRQAADAVERFDRALAHQPGYASALAGRGQALAALGRDAEALASYEAAFAADPSLDLGARIEVLRFKGAGDAVAEARRAAERGHLDDARDLYVKAIAASPDSAFLYRELGTIELEAGREAEALEQLRKAVTLDAADAKAQSLIGDLLAKQGQYEGAASAYAAAQALEPTLELEQKVEDARRRAEVSRLPAEYQAMATSAEVTRGDVAAALGARLGQQLSPLKARQGVLITDIRGHWAATWILAVVRAGIMDPLPNHTFQSRQRVRRADLAQTVGRVLNAIAVQRPSAATAWRTARLTMTDVSPGHPAYPAISQAVAAGVLPLGPDEVFQPGRPVTGAELVAAVNRLESLFGPAPRRR